MSERLFNSSLKPGKKLLLMMLIVTMMFGAFALSHITAFAATNSGDRIEVVLTTDKTSYVAGEKVNITASVKNGNKYDVDDISAALSLSSRLKLESGSGNIAINTLSGGDTATFNFTAIQNTNPVATASSPATGDSQSMMFLWLMIALMIAFAALLVLAIKKGRKLNKMFSVVICACLVSAFVIGANPVSANATGNEKTSFAAEESFVFENTNEKVAFAVSFDSLPELYNGIINIVHINDVHGFVAETNTGLGMAKVAGFFDQMKLEEENTLLLDAGDCFAGSPLNAFDRGLSVAEVLSTMDIDAMVSGNHDYTYGTDRLLMFRDIIGYPMLCANMVYKGTTQKILDSYEIIELPNRVRIGVIGLTTPASETMGSTNVTYINAIQECQKVVDEIKDKVDVVVALTHIGESDAAMNTNMIANNVIGLDLIIDGHTHTALPTGAMVNGVLVAQTGEYLKNIGHVTLNIADNEFVDASARLVPKADTANFPERAETKARVDRLLTESSAYFSAVVGSTDVALDATYNPGNNQGIRANEVAVGNFFSDVMRQKSGADVGLFVAGMIGGNIPGGSSITREMLMEVTRAPDVDIVVVNITGQGIIDYLQISSNSVPNASGAFLQISGITMDLDSAGLIGSKVSNVQIGSVGSATPINPSATYTLAVNSTALSAISKTDADVIGNYGKPLPILEEFIGSLTDNKITSTECFGDGRINRF